MSSQRQLAAITFCDIVGYTAMMQADEKHAIAIINRFRTTLEEMVARYDGRIVQYYGDGSLIVFKSAVQALEHAIALQEELQKEPKVPLRLGIHVGEVVFEDNKVFGDGVNLASRIESLGQPAAVLFSQRVLEEIRNHPEFTYKSLGHFNFKNVTSLTEVFALTNIGLEVPKRSQLEGKLSPVKKRSKVTVAILTIILSIVAYGGYHFGFKGKGEKASAISSVETKKVNTSIAVLPFVDMSADQDQEYFGDGLAEEVLNLLAQVSELDVTSRSSSFSFKEQKLDIPTLGQKLNVDYILEGSIRKDGSVKRVTAQLIHVQGDKHMWSQTYDTELKDVFAVQDRIANAVTQALKLTLLSSPPPKAPEPQAYNLFLQAKYLASKGNTQALSKAEELIKQSIVIDSTYAPSWGVLGRIYSREANTGARPAEEGHQLAKESLEKAMVLDSTYVPVYLDLSSSAIYYDWDFQLAARYLQKAEKIDPKNDGVLTLSSNLSFCLGELDESIRLSKEVITRDPVYAKNYLDLGYTYLFARRYDEAEASTREALVLNADYLGGYYLLSLILLHKGEVAAAQVAAEKEPFDILKWQAQSLVNFALNDLDASDTLLQKIENNYANEAGFQVAQVYGYRNDVDKAFLWLERAYDNRDGGLLHMKTDPLLTALHKDRRWEAFLEKMGFDTSKS
ncbi:MAG: adenylate/guanylate cyclase domain-containing protein [Cyclobacteriaceae bacterium]